MTLFLALTLCALWFAAEIALAVILSSDAFAQWLEAKVDIKPEEW